MLRAESELAMSATISPSQVKRLETRCLWIGKPLPAALRDLQGRVVLAAGRSLEQEDLQQYLRAVNANRFVFVGPEWPDIDRVVKDLEAERGKSTEGDDRRENQRHSWQVPMTLEVADAGFTNAREIKITTMDLSKGGFGFSFDQYIYPGSLTRSCFETLPNKPVLCGIVRSCVHLRGSTHRVGVEFSNLQ